MTDYLNRYDVRKALNVPDHVGPWNTCSDPVFKLYRPQIETSQWIYKLLKPHGYKMLFYSGDSDGIIATYGSRLWLKSLDWAIKEDWRPWIA